jgi:hypothetical protein
MRFSYALFAILVANASVLGADSGRRADFDWNRWRDLPVQNVAVASP